MPNKFRQGKNHIKYALLWTLFSFLINCLSSWAMWKPFALALRLFFSLRELFVSFSCWHHLSLSLFILTRALLPRCFQPSCHSPFPEPKGTFQGTLPYCVPGAAEMRLTASGLLQAQPAPQQLLSGLLTPRWARGTALPWFPCRQLQIRPSSHLPSVHIRGAEHSPFPLPATEKHAPIPTVRRWITLAAALLCASYKNPSCYCALVFFHLFSFFFFLSQKVSTGRAWMNFFEFPKLYYIQEKASQWNIWTWLSCQS